jgi:hypothetical protein
MESIWLTRWASILISLSFVRMINMDWSQFLSWLCSERNISEDILFTGSTLQKTYKNLTKDWTSFVGPHNTILSMRI